MDSFPPDAPAPRLCHVVKRADFEGFGFNLYAGKVKQGQFIGKVDGNSPAEAAGLKPGDRIIEVNSVNIGNENHKQVVQRIKLRPNETELLVVDDEADEYYTTRGVIVNSSQSNVTRKSSAAPIPAIRQESASSSETEVVPVQQQPVAFTNGSADNRSNSPDEDAPVVRLCHVVKWSDSDGFGFHLLADKKRKGQFIGKVDVGSAAEAAGLKLGDRIVEVNGHNVVNESHKEVVQRIKAVPGETRLLVVDPTGQLYYDERGVAISSDMPNVQVIKTPPATQSGSRPTSLKFAPETYNGGPAIPTHTSLKDVSLAPEPRLCHIIKWRADAGYGFHLLADKKRVGHFIGKVDADTPAASAGLRVSDRIIEVNGHNVTTETHKQIVERIKAVPNETRLLVLDPEADAYYAERGIQVSGTQSNVVHLRTPTARNNNKSSANTAGDSSSDDDGDVRVQLRHQNDGSQSPDSRYSKSYLQSRPLSMSTLTAAASTGLDLNMSAAELRARLAARKKFDPKRDTIDLRRKHEIIQTM